MPILFYCTHGSGSIQGSASRSCKIRQQSHWCLHWLQPACLWRHLVQPRGGSSAVRSNLFRKQVDIVPSTAAAAAARSLRGTAGLFLTTGTAGCTRGADTFAGAPASLTIGGGAPATLCASEGAARFWSRWDALICPTSWRQDFTEVVCV